MSEGEDFTFIWEDSEEHAKLLTKNKNEFVLSIDSNFEIE